MVTVLTIRSELESARRLRLTTATELPSDPGHLVIRWGNSQRPEGPREYAKVINRASRIYLNCHKGHALRRMASVVKIPQLYMHGATVPAGQLVVLRKREHSSGEGFQVRSGPFVVARGCYATAWLQTNVEYRVWYAFGKVLCARRVPMKEQRAQGIPPHPCRSEWGYSFRACSKRLANQVRAAFKAIGLDCGAADVLSVRGEFYFLELNSAPTIDARRIRKFYQRAINRYVGQEVCKL